MNDALALIQERLPWLLPAYAFAVGAAVGSFLNVVIARVPRGMSIVRPASRCPRCKAPIAWFDNVPIVSWLLLRAKCRRCGLPISARYPVVELLVGLLALALVRQFGFTVVALGWFAFAAALVALAYIDLDTWLLPHEITWPLLGVGLVSPLWNPHLRFVDSAIGAGAGIAVFAAVALFGERVLKRETMGWGDVWLLGGIGAWLGWQALLPVVLLSSLQGAVVGLLLIALGRDPSKRKPAGGAAVEEAPQPPGAADDAPAAGAELPAAADVAGAPAASPQPPATAADVADAPAAPASEGLDDDWVPPKHAVPFGPFLALAALEMLLVGHALVAAWDKGLGRLVP